MSLRNLLNPCYLYENRTQLKPVLVGRQKYYMQQCNKWFNAHGIHLTKNDRLLASLNSKHCERRCFIVGNGPSLRIEDLDLLVDEITFAANKIYLSYESTAWRPKYYFVEDTLVLKQNWDTINKLGGCRFFPRVAKEWAPEIRGGIYYEFNSEPVTEDFPSFGDDPLTGFFWGSTVVYSMLQFAFYMGCNPIYLIGVDFSFNLPGKPADGIELECEGEINHFHPDYRKVGEKWNVPNLNLQEKTFLRVKGTAEDRGISVYNATRGGKLEVFSRTDFSQLF
jgi:6-hydroxymethylpterin diphosphokinase MptE-like